MTGRLTVVGLGPGPASWVAPAAAAALAHATDIFGYRPYIERLTPLPGQRFHGSDNREEVSRASAALEAAAAGRGAALVSGGDPGVFAMAAAVFEAIEQGPCSWRTLDLAIEPGITAMLAAAARVGAPLGHDFCAISLSDNLKPWSLVEKRLKLAAEAGFALALYNPASRARPSAARQAFEVLARVCAPTTPVVLARAVGRPEEAIEVASLDRADLSRVDMQTLIIVGSPETRLVARGPSVRPWVYTPRRTERA